MQDESMTPMTAENVNEFDVWIHDARELVLSITPICPPRSASTEIYNIDQQSDN